jgi:uncharacterized membrane protein YfcA
MIAIFVGIIVGIVMGLTGAGGALVAIPLFMQLMGMTLKQASLYSLIAVVFASIFNYYHQRQFANKKLGLLLFIFSIIGSIIAIPYKPMMPDAMIAWLLIIIALYSLFTIWKPVSIKPKVKLSQKKLLMITIMSGFILGLLTTFTGLGGGVLILPILIGIYGLNQNISVATSLLSIGLSSTFSFVAQIIHGSQVDFDYQLASIILGIVIASFIIKKALVNISAANLALIRKIVFSIVVALAIIKLVDI